MMKHVEYVEEYVAYESTLNSLPVGISLLVFIPLYLIRWSDRM